MNCHGLSLRGPHRYLSVFSVAVTSVSASLGDSVHRQIGRSTQIDALSGPSSSLVAALIRRVRMRFAIWLGAVGVIPAKLANAGRTYVMPRRACRSIRHKGLRP